MRRKIDKAVIWDLDGVIADTAPFHFQAWREVVESRGRGYTEKDFQHGFGLRNDDILRYLFGDLTSEEIETLSKKKEDIFRARIKDNIKALPGVLRLLEILRKEGFGIALVSSAPIENIELVLSSLDVGKYFDCIISADDVTKGKPDPQGFLLAAKRLGMEPNQCLVIEDATAGVQAAKAAGMKCIAVTNMHPQEALAKSDLVTDNLEKISNEGIHRLLCAI